MYFYLIAVVLIVDLILERKTENITHYYIFIECPHNSGLTIREYFLSAHKCSELHTWRTIAKSKCTLYALLVQRSTSHTERHWNQVYNILFNALMVLLQKCCFIADHKIKAKFWCFPTLLLLIVSLKLTDVPSNRLIKDQ